MIRQILYFFLAISAFGCNYSNNSDATFKDTTHYNIGDTILPFKNFDFTKGSWTAKILMHDDDKKDLSPLLNNKQAFSTNDSIKLKPLESWKFIFTNGDVATVQSTFKLYHEDTLIASFGIVLDKNSVGFQTRHYGWTPAANPNDILQTIAHFE